MDVPGYSKKDIAALAKSLREIAPWRPALEIVLHWALLIGVIALVVAYAPWWLYPLAWPAIGALQYALLILLHDAQHTLLHPDKRINNALATWLIAAPCCTEFSRSQKHHLAHHQHLGDAGHDPDYPLYAPRHNRHELLLHFARRVTRILLAARVRQEQGQGSWLPVIAMQLAIFSLFAALAGWQYYLLLWLIPLAGCAALFNDLRIFCEHSNPRDGGADGLMISYESHPLERFFLAPNHMNYHAEHHLFPHVPHSRLPKLRALIKQTPELNEAIQWRSSYARHLMHYLRHLRT